MRANNKRPLTASDGDGVRAARLRKDMSAIFEIPTVPLDVVAAPQPDGFRGNMFDYQRRSLARMLEIERGLSLTIREGERSTGRSFGTFSPNGGVIADTVGMGKTAEIIALLLSQPPVNADGGTLAALVLTPEHLCLQWRAEIRKFAGDALDVALLTNEAQTNGLGTAWGGRGGTARVLIASLEHVCCGFGGKCNHTGEMWSLLSAANVRTYDRLILDECHDAVLLNGGNSMNMLLWLREKARKVWCVTGTPFPAGDRSVFGLHQLVGVNLNFVITNSPFLRPDRPLPAEHPFEQLKRTASVSRTRNLLLRPACRPGD